MGAGIICTSITGAVIGTTILSALIFAVFLETCIGSCGREASEPRDC
jgi:hypothetical protein